MRWALGIEYNGSCYSGWQSQPNLKTTIQHHLEFALSKLADHPINVTCAGRTDAGVHATGQVVHFDTDVQREERAWLLGSNAYLPKNIRVKWIQAVAKQFHARYSAVSRRYQYCIYNSGTSSAIFSEKLTWCHQYLHVDKMIEAGQYLIGEHDFTSYRANDCQAKNPIRNVQKFSVYRKNSFVILDITANAFLHHMVRNIAGVLITIGKSEQPPIWAQQVLHFRDRKLAGITAPAHGLYLVQVNYPVEYQLPVNEPLPWL